MQPKDVKKCVPLIRYLEPYYLSVDFKVVPTNTMVYEANKL
jgi:hypothetical protein